MDVADTGEVPTSGVGTESTEKPPVPAPPANTRPVLQRNALQRSQQIEPSFASQHASQQPGKPILGPSDSPQNQGPPQPTDSLSLAQLRRIVTEVNRNDNLAYDFVYADTGPHAEEIDEWFMYQFWQWVRLNSAQKAFEWHWNNDTGGEHAWDDADHDTRAKFVSAAIAGVQSNDAALRLASIGKITYLILGRWGDTAMPSATDGQSKSTASIPQLQAIKAGVECLSSLEGLPVIWEALQNAFAQHW